MAGFLGLTTRFVAKVKSNLIFEPLREWLVGKASINKEASEEFFLGQGDLSKEASLATPGREGQEVTRRWLREAWQRSPRFNLIENYFDHDQNYCREESMSKVSPTASIDYPKTLISAAAPSPAQKYSPASDPTAAAPNFTLQLFPSSNKPEAYEATYLSMHQNRPSQRLRRSSHRKRRQRGRVFRRRQALFRGGPDRNHTPVVRLRTWYKLPPIPPPLATWAKRITSLLNVYLMHADEDIPDPLTHLDQMGVWGGAFLQLRMSLSGDTWKSKAFLLIWSLLHSRKYSARFRALATATLESEEAAEQLAEFGWYLTSSLTSATLSPDVILLLEAAKAWVSGPLWSISWQSLWVSACTAVSTLKHSKYIHAHLPGKSFVCDNRFEALNRQDGSGYGKAKGFQHERARKMSKKSKQRKKTVRRNRRRKAPGGKRRFSVPVNLNSSAPQVQVMGHAADTYSNPLELKLAVFPRLPGESLSDYAVRVQARIQRLTFNCAQTPEASALLDRAIQRDLLDPMQQMIDQAKQANGERSTHLMLKFSRVEAELAEGSRHLSSLTAELTGIVPPSHGIGGSASTVVDDGWDQPLESARQLPVGAVVADKSGGGSSGLDNTCGGGGPGRVHSQEHRQQSEEIREGETAVTGGERMVELLAPRAHFTSTVKQA